MHGHITREGTHKSIRNLAKRMLFSDNHTNLSDNKVRYQNFHYFYGNIKC